MAKQRRKLTPSERIAIRLRALFLCEYCYSPEDFSPDTYDADHIIPLFKEGTDDLENMALACGKCNGLKHEHVSWLDPLTHQMTPLFHPRQDAWAEHFAWSDDFTLIIGLTPKGRATIDLLKMNRQNLINLRKALVAYNAHPGKLKESLTGLE